MACFTMYYILPHHQMLFYFDCTLFCDIEYGLVVTYNGHPSQGWYGLRQGRQVVEEGASSALLTELL